MEEEEREVSEIIAEYGDEEKVIKKRKSEL